MNSPALKRPLVFGDAAQIAALRDEERDREYKQAFDELTDCDQCLGDGDSCLSCHRQCDACDGTGKDPDELKKFRERFPDCRFCG